MTMESHAQAGEYGDQRWPQPTSEYPGTWAGVFFMSDCQKALALSVNIWRLTTTPSPPPHTHAFFLPLSCSPVYL
jgi:hypothetical protein